MSAARRILVAFDFSPPATRALEVARYLRARLHAALDVIYVADPIWATSDEPASGSRGAASSTPGPSATVLMGHALARELASRVAEVMGPEASAVSLHVEVGVPADVIRAKAESVHADMIVAGTTGRSGVERILLGSTALRLVRASDVPVLTVH